MGGYPRYCREHLSRRGAQLALCLFLSLCAVSGPAMAGGLAETRAALAQFEEASQAMAAARAIGDQGAFAAASRRAEESLKTAWSSLDKQPDRAATADYLETRAAILSAQGDHDLAAEALESALARAPERAAIWLLLAEGRAAMGPGGQETAFDAVQRFLESEPTGSEAARAHYLMGDIYRRRGLYRFAREEFEQAQDLNADHVLNRIALAAMMLRDGQIIEASTIIDDLGRAAQPYDTETRVLLREALAGFTSARHYFPDRAEYHHAYARLLYRAARLPEAIVATRRGLHLLPNDFEKWNFLAAMQIQIGNLPQAREAYEKSLEANPDQPQVRASLEQFKAPASGNAGPGEGTVLR